MLTILLLASAPIAVAVIVAIGIRLINLPPPPDSAHLPRGSRSWQAAFLPWRWPRWCGSRS